MADQLKHIVVLGAGVVGLTTALKIQEHGGYSVTILAERFSSDPKSIQYTSHWAGAHHITDADSEHDPRTLEIDQETFNMMWKLSAPEGPAEGCFLRIEQREFYPETVDASKRFGWYPDFEVLRKEDLPPPTEYGVSFSTLTIDTPIYLNYLLSRFLAAGGSITRGHVQHISQVIEGGARLFNRSSGGRISRDLPLVDAVVVCAGIGARSLGGVEDKSVHPVRGQTVVVRAPWIRSGRTARKDGVSTYIIPRRSGDVIVGGIRAAGDWYPIPRPETTEDILQRGFALCPELAPPDIRALRDPTVDDVRPLIVEEGCGLRPARTGGIRLEIEWVQSVRGANPRKALIVHNYGHGGGGFQSSWGSASKALRLLEEALDQSQKE